MDGGGWEGGRERGREWEGRGGVRKEREREERRKGGEEKQEEKEGRKKEGIRQCMRT